MNPLRAVAWRLPEAQVPRPKAIERTTIGPDKIGPDRVSRGHEPRVVLTKPRGTAALEPGDAARLCEMQTLNGEALQEAKRGRFVVGALEDLRDRHHRDDQPAAPERGQEAVGGSALATRRFALQGDEKRRVEQDRTGHGFFCASPSPLPFEAATSSARSSPVSIGPA